MPSFLSPVQQPVKERQVAILLQLHGELDGGPDIVQIVKEFFYHHSPKKAECVIKISLP